MPQTTTDQQLRQRIVELEKAEEASRHREALLRIFVTHAPVSVVMCDKNMRWLAYSRRVVQDYRLGNEDLTGRYHYDIVPDLPETWKKDHQRVLAGETITVEEERFYRADGREEWVRREVIPWRDASDQIGGIIIFNQLITERKLAEQKLIESESNYRQLFSAVLDAIIIVDSETRKIVNANPAAQRLYGYDYTDMCELSVNALSAEPDKPFEHAESIEGGLPNEIPPAVAQRLHKRKDGSVFPVEITTSRYDLDGHRKMIYAIIRDVSERKRAEEALMKAHFIINASPAAAFLWVNAEGWPVEFVTENVKNIFGYTDKDFMSGRIAYSRVIHPDDLERVSDEVALASADPSCNEFSHQPYRIINSEGQTRWVEDKTVIQRDLSGNVTHYQGIVEDVTEAHRRKEELQRIEKLESLGVLAGGIAHDFNNFLTGMLGNLSLIKMDTGSSDAIYPHLEDMEMAALRARDLTQQLLTFSKGGLPVKRTAEISRLVKDAALFAMRGSNVRCDFDFRSEPLYAEVDEGQMTQVIHNLVLNAVQAMPEGGVVAIGGGPVEFSTGNALSLEPGAYVQLTFKDRGVGIQKEHLKKIFDPYYSTKHKGSGLGLSVVHSVIEKHRGRIEVDSQIDRGTTFDIYLPAEPQAEPAPKNLQSKMYTGSGRILIMDDESYIRTLVSKMLEKMGYTVTPAQDGSEAIRLYQESFGANRPYDAVILDLTVPGGKGGRETIKSLREIDPNVRAIVSSGYSNDPIMSDFRRYGFCQAVKKPFQLQELSEAMKSVLLPLQDA